MRRPLPVLAMALVLSLVSCGSGDQPREDPAPAVAGEEDTAVAVPVEISAELVDPEGSVLGQVEFRDDEGRAVVEVEVSGLTAGFHPVTLHVHGACEDPGDAGPQPGPFPAAGEPFQVLPPLLVLDGGVGSMATLAGPASLEDLLAGDGTALVVHRALDGPAALAPPAAVDTGSRLACGAVRG